MRSRAALALSLLSLASLGALPPPGPASFREGLADVAEELIAECTPVDVGKLFAYRDRQYERYRLFLVNDLLQAPPSVVDRQYEVALPISPLELANTLFDGGLSGKQISASIANHYSRPDDEENRVPFSVWEQECEKSLKSAVKGAADGGFGLLKAKLESQMAYTKDSKRRLTVRIGRFTSSLPSWFTSNATHAAVSREETGAMMSFWLLYHQNPDFVTSPPKMLTRFSGAAVLYDERETLTIDRDADEQIEVALGAALVNARLEQNLRSQHAMQQTRAYGSYLTFVLKDQSGDQDLTPIPGPGHIFDAWERRVKQMPRKVTVNLNERGEGWGKLELPGLPSDPEEAQVFVRNLRVSAKFADASSVETARLSVQLKTGEDGTPDYERGNLDSGPRETPPIPQVTLEIKLAESLVPGLTQKVIPEENVTIGLDFSGVDVLAGGVKRTLTVDYALTLSAQYQDHSFADPITPSASGGSGGGYLWKVPLPTRDYKGIPIKSWAFLLNDKGTKVYSVAPGQPNLMDYRSELVSNLELKREDGVWYLMIRSIRERIPAEADTADKLRFVISLTSTPDVPGAQPTPWTLKPLLDLGPLLEHCVPVPSSRELRDVLRPDAVTRDGSALEQQLDQVAALETTSARNDYLIQLFEKDQIRLDREAGRYIIVEDLVKR